MFVSRFLFILDFMIPWDIPTSDEEIPRLTHIYRNQHFLVWLAAMDLESKDIYILRTVEWKKIIEIAVDPKRQRGRRSTLISDPSPQQPTIYDENLSIPTCALYPPTGNAILLMRSNSAQVLVWRPTSGQPTLVVPPKSIEINTTNYAHLPLARY
ncbi:unnamed protein product [Adineta ricciae]|uniref:Uncharacterized protein n=1 Tax=Adineta ricciae TaxID=249248 RepID=A0A815YMY0_ADIRI|nr:unnamed protein product [Adineta ricciae]